jgi:hypothetical protein
MTKLIMAGSSVLVFLFLLQGCAGQGRSSARLVDAGNGTCRDTVSGQMWRIEKSGMMSSLEEAQAYIARLNEAGEYRDWRLPTVFELYDLNYHFDLHLNGDCNLDRSGRYWSGEKDGQGTVGAWEIGDQCDPERQYRPGTKGYVRAVRP